MSTATKRGPMSPDSDSAEATTFPFPVRIHHDRAAERLRVAVDAFPEAIDDVTVEVGPRKLRITIDRAGESYERTISPPSVRYGFGCDRRALYNNGVLSVTLETDRHGR